MRIDIISAVPQLIHSPLNHSILKRAQEREKVAIHLHDLHPYGQGKHKHIDDKPYGGAPGMVLKPEPIFDCIENLQKQRDYDHIIYMTADGETLNQQTLNTLAKAQNLILLCGHYKGIDERVRDHLITKEISIGDYVLTGGELPAAILADGIVRLIPGVINNSASALTDSFQKPILGQPLYTRPATYRNWTVPHVLRNGNHKEIAQWEAAQSKKRTEERRPDLLNQHPPAQKSKETIAAKQKQITQTLHQLARESPTILYQYIVAKGEALPPLASESKTTANLISGCQSRVWITVTAYNGRLFLQGDSDAAITKGLVAILIEIYAGHTTAEIEKSPCLSATLNLDSLISLQRRDGMQTIEAHIHQITQSVKQ